MLRCWSLGKKRSKVAAFGSDVIQITASQYDDENRGETNPTYYFNRPRKQSLKYSRHEKHSC